MVKYVLILCLIALVTFASGRPSCTGCVTTLEGDDLKRSEEVLNKSLSTLAAGDGPFYKLVKVNSATVQVVAGRKDVINADLKDQKENLKTCNIEIWSQPWLDNGITVEFDCPGEEKLVKKHSA